MFESLLQTCSASTWAATLLRAGESGRLGYAACSPRSAAVRDQDGYVCVLVYNDKQWRAFFELIGRPELLRTRATRRRRRAAATSRAPTRWSPADEEAQHTAEWIAALEAADIRCSA
jgi:crotonobetainyl-CoA:carnitine CoA-transferase CaiB-like acyl-CoA transferase